MQPHRVEELQTRLLGHDDVADDEPDLVVHEELEGLGRRGGGDDLVARGEEHLADHVSDDRIVVDDKDLDHCADPAIGRRRTNEAPADDRGQRNQIAAVTACDLEARREPEARSAVLRRRERLEQAGTRIRVDARAGVGDPCDRPVAVPLELDGDAAAVGQGLLSVDEQAEKDLAEADGVPANVQGLLRILLSELDALAGARAANELDGPLGDLLKRYDLGQLPVGTGEAEERLRDALDLEAALRDQ